MIHILSVLINRCDAISYGLRKDLQIKPTINFLGAFELLHY